MSLIASAFKNGTIKILDIFTGEILQNLEGHTSIVNSICFSSDENKIVSCSDDKTIKIWDVYTGELINTLTGHTDSVISVCFSNEIEGSYI
jgi:WD40 repeat protein